MRLLAVFFLLLMLPGFAAAQEFKAMTYNIRYDTERDGINRWDARKDWVSEVILDQKPAVLGVQEALHHQVVYLDSALTSYAYVGVARDDGNQKGEYTAVFIDTTLFQFMDSGTFWLSPTPDTVSVGWDAALERICTFVQLRNRQNGKRLRVFNAHLDHRGALSRLNALKLIHDKSKEWTTGDEAVILMGDLNATPDSDPIQYISQYFSDAFEMAKNRMQGPAGTFHGFNPQHPMDARIDYIFTRDLRTLSYHNLHLQDGNRFPSDHTAVIALLRLEADEN